VELLEGERELAQRQRRVEELETMNAELRARLIRLQAVPSGSAATTGRLDEQPTGCPGVTGPLTSGCGARIVGEP
jgi:hypothetical protein